LWGWEIWCSLSLSELGVINFEHFFAIIHYFFKYFFHSILSSPSHSLIVSIFTLWNCLISLRFCFLFHFFLFVFLFEIFLLVFKFIILSGLCYQ
jgi:hypothetical protein